MSKIYVETAKCIDCGACTAVCNSNALRLDTVSWSLIFDKQKCTGCKLCISACPMRALKASSNISSAAS
ncbi:MAG TPA: 4Fe-4S binding protein [Thermoanaerobacterales bacterium]|uniref:4Fe-4S dicluster domain-containing protein n=1 Tax=Tepidanaerobacter sp. GT38 TaxID=2722793 RepID=UPI001836674D|nr:4Fe-4S dicluster domain-containing protein [Tepidanaerobacter sp. GT38]MCG1012541.1 4Fe-4S binding protein [Tepidanaerobacter sp. GT38]HHY42843.1 4Fe-4S binding protein [Thermoanaerobacterales bacterium]